MTPNEVKLWVALIKAEKEIDDSNPDVGFGPALGTLMHRAWKRANISLTASDHNYIMEKYKQDTKNK